MHPDKSPGPGRIGFIRNFGTLLGGNVIKVVKQFFDTVKFENNITETNIVLISKKLNPTKMTDLKPIFLCNVVYKVVSKVLANRFKKVLNFLILETQSAFVSGRLITDNIMIYFDVMHYMKRKTLDKT